MSPLLVYRPSLMPAEELSVASHHLRTSPSRLDAGPGDVVIARYSALPFYAEQEADYRRLGAAMINSLQAHSFVADLGNYTEILGELTPATMRYDDWTRRGCAALGDGPWVLKGATNSRKHDWKTHMFAATRAEAHAVANRLMGDGLVGNQTLYIRACVPLARYGELLGGLPVTREFRFFVLDGEVLSGGFYWASFAGDLGEWGHTVPDPSEVPRAFLDAAAGRIEHRCRFYALDVAQDETGRWWVIELNDAQMAGLSGNDPSGSTRRCPGRSGEVPRLPLATDSTTPGSAHRAEAHLRPSIPGVSGISASVGAAAGSDTGVRRRGTAVRVVRQGRRGGAPEGRRHGDQKATAASQDGASVVVVWRILARGHRWQR